MGLDPGVAAAAVAVPIGAGAAVVAEEEEEEGVAAAAAAAEEGPVRWCARWRRCECKGCDACQGRGGGGEGEDRCRPEGEVLLRGTAVAVVAQEKDRVGASMGTVVPPLLDTPAVLLWWGCSK